MVADCNADTSELRASTAKATKAALAALTKKMTDSCRVEMSDYK